MCAQFILKANANDLSIKFGVHLPQNLNFNLRVHGYMKTELAPVITSENGKLVLREMFFSLCPHWSEKFPFPWTSYNARMERDKKSKDGKLLLDKSGNPISEFIYQIPTWRDAFNNGQTCLVPMTSAIESSYFGTHAGQIIQFSQSSDEIFYAVGLVSSWLDKFTGEVKDTFTLITDDPYEYFLSAGHDRSVFVIKDSEVDKWLLDQKMKPLDRFNFLRANRITLDWKVTTERQMAKGWEKKVPSTEEISQIKIWKQAT